MNARRTFVKICGITQPKHAELAAILGADAIGMIFYPKSKRFISLASALNVAEAAWKYGKPSVGVFVNPSLDMLEETLQFVPLDFIQLHGNETPAFIEDVLSAFPDQKVIKALRLNSPETDLQHSATYELLDHSSQEWGGTGQTISWEDARDYVKKNDRPVILAGGLNADNIKRAIETVNPFGVDLSSGVELSPGVKSEDKLRKLFEELGRG